MSAIVVYHESYGCDTGCCGHRITMEGVAPGYWVETGKGGFDFTHPGWDYGNNRPQDPFEWAKEWVRETFGEEHVKDLDWENCLVLDD